MRTNLVIGVQAHTLEEVSTALSKATGIKADFHDSSFLGVYDLLLLPEKLIVKYNYVEEQDDYDYPERKDIPVIIVAGDTERPEFLLKLIGGLSFKHEILKCKL